MGKRVVTVSVVWSGLGWGAYSPRSRLGLPGGKRRPGASRSPERERWENAWQRRYWGGSVGAGRSARLSSLKTSRNFFVVR